MRWVVVLCAALVSTAAAQASPKNSCALVTVEDAVAVVGPTAVKQIDTGKNCVYGAAGQKLHLAVAADSGPHAKDGMEMPKLMVSKYGGTVKDEPGVGAGAYSTTIKGAQTVYVFKRGTAVSISAATDANTPFPDMLDKLRAIAKKTLGRL